MSGGVDESSNFSGLIFSPRCYALATRSKRLASHTLWRRGATPMIQGRPGSCHPRFSICYPSSLKTVPSGCERY